MTSKTQDSFSAPSNLKNCVCFSGDLINENIYVEAGTTKQKIRKSD